MRRPARWDFWIKHLIDEEYLHMEIGRTDHSSASLKISRQVGCFRKALNVTGSCLLD
jgi:hypothetical protein